MLSTADVFGLRRPVIHQDIVRALHVMAFEENKSARNVAENFRIDSVNDVHAGGTELQQDRGDGLHVLEFAQFVGDLDRHGRAAEREKDGSGGRLQHDVRADAFDALGGFLQQAAGEADDQDDERDFHGDSHSADEGAQGAVEQVAADEFTHHGCLVSAGSPTFTNSDPAGCSRLKRSAGIVSFKLTLVIFKSSL